MEEALPYESILVLEDRRSAVLQKLMSESKVCDARTIKRRISAHVPAQMVAVILQLMCGITNSPKNAHYFTSLGEGQQNDGMDMQRRMIV